MRRCAGCQQVPRRDDALETVQIDGLGTFQACRACVARHDGRPEPLELHPCGSNRPYPVCGVCRQALRDDDTPQCMRLHPADVAGTSIQAGCYSCCRDCVELFRPTIHQRLTDLGYKLQLADIQGDWLL